MLKGKVEKRVPLMLSNRPFPEFQNSRIPEFQNPESGILGSRDPGIPEIANLKAEVVPVFLPSNWPFPEFQDPGIPGFRIPDSGILEF